MATNYVATLLVGSGLGSTILGVVFALVYLKKNNIQCRLKVNINNASSTSKVFFSNLKVINDIEIVDMPVCSKKIDDILHVKTPSLDGIELFHAPGIPGFSLFTTDFDFLKRVFKSFWEEIDLINYYPSDYVCLHIRRGDKLIYEKDLKVHKIQNYIDEIQRKKLTNQPILIITDEYNTFLEFKQVYGDNVLIGTTSTPENKGFNITTINSETPERVNDEVDNMVRDFNIIYNSSYFIGTRSSCVSFIGSLLVDENKISLLD